MNGAIFLRLSSAVMAVGSFALTATLASGCLGDALSMRLGATLAAGGLTAAAVAVAVLSGQRIYRPLNRYIGDLAQIGMQATLPSPEELPRLPAGHPLASMAREVSANYAQLCDRVQSLEQSRTAMEVRCHRAVQDAEGVRSIFAGLSDPILAIDEYDELVMTNRSAQELLQIEGEPVERAIGRIIHCQKLVELLTSTSRRKVVGSRTEEIELAAPDGEVHCYRATAAKLAVEADEVACHGAVAVLRDISDRKALQKRNAEFVSSVSHEMKTPLAGIKAYVELLADGDAEDEATREEFLQVIHGQTDRMQRLIDNLLNLARIEAGVVQVRKSPRALNEMLEEALRVVRPSAEAKQITLVADLSPLYLGVLADRDMLLQAAINLLSNAIKYTPNGGQVRLRSRMADEEIEFEVEDTGVGLSEEDKYKVFEKFYRVKKDKDMASGTGLGLPLAKHIVEDVHGGRIVVESELGKGSTFSVILPNAGQRISAV